MIGFAMTFSSYVYISHVPFLFTDSHCVDVCALWIKDTLVWEECVKEGIFKKNIYF